MTEIFTAEEHVQVYDLWQRRGDRDLRLSHIDFHCDMRGLLIDRRRGVAYRIDEGDRRMSEVDSGNFLGHAIMQGIVTSVRWVHDPHGGRQFDVGTVKYATDATALPHRLLRGLRGPGHEVPIAYDDLTFAEWDGVQAGEQLDIDWDGIGAIAYDVPHIRRLMDDVIERAFTVAKPREVYLVYSPGYAHPDRALYDEFLERLRRRLEAKVAVLPTYAGSPHHAQPQTALAAIEERVVLGLKRLGIH